ncbi:hypothetical protein BESB_078800 [Besnoitia besnoiti]|uniref:Uncharacterized protein n=1 Tax=Besnoitia besnoiti TaxID=94643 RepID=A0A2A9M900_BESBE|nr:hypothetical protein BESB_078800 [Besnoitia besnoiti]PFH33664.1 hypothetical protein BESB_078800 [Besnoitia besnoiti]
MENSAETGKCRFTEVWRYPCRTREAHTPMYVREPARKPPLALPRQRSPAHPPAPAHVGVDMCVRQVGGVSGVAQAGDHEFDNDSISERAPARQSTAAMKPRPPSDAPVSTIFALGLSDVDELLQDLTEAFPEKKPSSPARSCAGLMTARRSPSAGQLSSSLGHDSSSSVSLRLSASTPLPENASRSPQTGALPASLGLRLSKADSQGFSPSQPRLANVESGVKSPRDASLMSQTWGVAALTPKATSSSTQPRADNCSGTLATPVAYHERLPASRSACDSQELTPAKGLQDDDLTALLPDGRSKRLSPSERLANAACTTGTPPPTSAAPLLTRSLVQAANDSTKST